LARYIACAPDRFAVVKGRCGGGVGLRLAARGRGGNFSTLC